MNNEFVMHLPHQTPQWNEIKTILSKISKMRLDIYNLISLLDYLEHIVNLHHPSATLQLLPSRDTFIGLGNFLFYHVSDSQRQSILSYTIPRIINFAIDLEAYSIQTPLNYSKAFQVFSLSLPRFQAVSLLASSILCLFATSQKRNLLLNDMNFTYFFSGITSEHSTHVDKLRAIFEYFDFMSGSYKKGDISASFKVHRRFIRAKFLNETRNGSEHTRVSLPCSGDQLARVLRCHFLPLVLVDHALSKESISDDFGLPVVDFARGYAGGDVLRSTDLSKESVYFRYPESLIALSLCYRFEETEALWLDECVGPFGVQDKQPISITSSRRLVIANSTNFPVWASELQYTEACLISDIMKMTAGLFQLDVEDSLIEKCTDPSPFSEDWWILHTGSTPPADTRPIPSLNVVAESAFSFANQEFQKISIFAEHLCIDILKKSMRISLRFLLSSNELRRSDVGSSSSLLPADGNSSAVFAGYTNTSRLDSFKDWRTSFSESSRIPNVVSALVDEVIDDAKINAASRLYRTRNYAESMTRQLLSGFVAPSALVFLTRANFDGTQLQSSTVLRTSDYTAETPDGLLSTFVDETNPVYRQIVHYSVGLVSRCLLGALIDVRNYYIIRAQHDFSLYDGFNVGSTPTTPSVPSCINRRPAGFVSSAAQNGANAQISFCLQWIAAAIASGRSSSLTRKSDKGDDQSPPSYISPLVFSTSGVPALEHLHTVVGVIGSACWTAGDLLTALLDYCRYRQRTLSGRAKLSSASSGKRSVNVCSFFHFLLSGFSSDLNLSV